jgi:hypothetical protein
MTKEKRRILVCSFFAVTLGFFGGYVGGQISTSVHSQKCQNQSFGWQQACSLINAPQTAWKGWQGTTRGLWTGAVAGGFMGGVVTKRTRRP